MAVRPNLLPREYAPRPTVTGADLAVLAALIALAALGWLLWQQLEEAQARAKGVEATLVRLQQEAQQYQLDRPAALPAEAEIKQRRTALEEQKKNVTAQQTAVKSQLGGLYPYSRVLRTLLEAVPAAVEVNRIERKGSSISVVGDARDREELVLYSSRLEASGLFSWVDVSLNLAAGGAATRPGAGQAPVVTPAPSRHSFTLVAALKPPEAP